MFYIDMITKSTTKE